MAGGLLRPGNLAHSKAQEYESPYGDLTEKPPGKPADHEFQGALSETCCL